MAQPLDRRQFLQLTDFARRPARLAGPGSHGAISVDAYADSASDLASVVAIGNGCLAHHGVVCEACRDVCPQAAIRFMPRTGAPFLPEIRAAACTGCGVCIETCPAVAIRVVPRAETSHA